MKKLAVILCSFLVLAWAASGWAQTFERGQISGTVYDPQHAIIPKAKVTLSNPSTGYSRTVEADDAGVYAFPQIPPGEYQIVAEYGNLAPITLKGIQVHVGSSIALDVTLPLKGQAQTIEVTEAGGAVDTTTAGVSQLINAQSVSSLPLAGRDYRDLAQLSPAAQVVPGLRGFIRLGGQQSDYNGLSIDGGDAYDNFFGEGFGSLETKNFTIPLEAVQEFQVVSNGFGPEFGRATGGLINVVTKSGTNELHGSAHYFVRGSSLTHDDALGFPSSIRLQQQFGGSVGFPVVKDKHFLFFAGDVQRQDGPLLTKFARNVKGVAVPAPYNISDLSSLEGPHTQFQNLGSVLGHYDWQMTKIHHLSARSFYTRNSTNGFTGGRGQNSTIASFDNTEIFENWGVNTVVALNSAWGKVLNEIRVMHSWETRPRDANGTNPETQINDTGIFGQRFFLPIRGDFRKVQVQDNVQYVFGKHDMKFGGDVNAYAEIGDIFIGWSRGTYTFATLEDFINRTPCCFTQGFGQNGKSIQDSNRLDVWYQTAVGLYWQDKWLATPHLTITYGVRWDATINPQPQTKIAGDRVYVGHGPLGSGTRIVPVPQRVPYDLSQIGPRVGVAYTFGSNHITTIRGAWGLYYAQTPPIFMNNAGSGKEATLFCFSPSCFPPGGYPNLFPSTLSAGVPASFGAPGINYIDPDFRNPRVSNLNLTVEHQFARDWTFSGSYIFVHSWRLRTGGFSSTQWFRNFVAPTVACSSTVTSNCIDQFGRSILGGTPLDSSIFFAQELASFSRGNFHEMVLTVNKRFSKRYQFFANYTLSSNKDNASTERDTDSFFGPQDPFNLELDYGRSGLDIQHQFKGAFVVELPYGFTLSTLAIAHSGLAYPAYISSDTNGDGVVNQVASNDRPVVTSGSSSFLLPRFPARQPNFFQLDFRLNKTFTFSERYKIEALAEVFNLFNRDNLFSNPNVGAFVNPTLTAIPTPSGQRCPPCTPSYGLLTQISPGGTPIAAQFGARFRF